jgi:hypothetical protein
MLANLAQNGSKAEFDRFNSYQGDKALGIWRTSKEM